MERASKETIEQKEFFLAVVEFSVRRLSLMCRESINVTTKTT